MSPSAFHVRSASGNLVSLLNTHPVEPHDALQAYVPLGRPDREPARPPAQPVKRNQCHLCLKIFTTSGHLTRHLKVHTGAKDHRCPFPACGARCSRHDNLQQHYTSHLTPAERSRGHVYTRRALASMLLSQAEADNDEPTVSPLPLSPSESSPSMDDEPVPNLSPDTPHVASLPATHRVSAQGSSALSPTTPTFPFTFSRHPYPLSPTTIEEPSSSSSTHTSARQRPIARPFPVRSANRIEGYEISFLRTDCG